MREHDLPDIAQQERDAFAKRLREALSSAGSSNITPTQIAKFFNSQTTFPVSTHAVRRWVLGEAIPRQHHVETLASWLACDAAWLRYGVGRQKVKQSFGSHEDFILLQELSRLDPTAKQLIHGLVAILKKA